MREFFKGWRRKVGCITLVMACAVCGVWLRSRVVFDMILFERDDRQNIVIVTNELVSWLSWDNDPIGNGNRYKSLSPDLAEIIADELKSLRSKPKFDEWTISYRYLVLPLTLLSAYLLLWKPRKRTEPDHA